MKERPLKRLMEKTPLGKRRRLQREQAMLDDLEAGELSNERDLYERAVTTTLWNVDAAPVGIRRERGFRIKRRIPPQQQQDGIEDMAAQQESRALSLSQSAAGESQTGQQTKAERNWRRSWRKNRRDLLFAAGGIAVIGGALSLAIFHHPSDEPTAVTHGGVGTGSLSSPNSGNAESPSQAPGVNPRLDMPHDREEATLINDGLSPDTAKRLVVEPGEVRSALDRFSALIQDTPFANLTFPNGESIPATIQRLEHHDNLALSEDFYAAVSQNGIEYRLTSNDPVMNATTSISVKETFKYVGGELLVDREMRARVANRDGDLYGVADPSAAVSTGDFRLWNADALANRLQFQHSIPGMGSGNARVYVSELNGTLGIFDNGTVIYSINNVPVSHSNVPDLLDMAGGGIDQPSRDRAVTDFALTADTSNPFLTGGDVFVPKNDELQKLYSDAVVGTPS